MVVSDIRKSRALSRGSLEFGIISRPDRRGATTCRRQCEACLQSLRWQLPELHIAGTFTQGVMVVDVAQRVMAAKRARLATIL